MKRSNFSRISFLIVHIFASVISAQSAVVINEIYGYGGNSGAVYNRDYVELFNNGGSPVNLSGYTLWYAPATVNYMFTAASSITLSGTIAANGYFLIALNSGSNGANLPTADISGSVNLNANDGNLLLTDSSFSAAAPFSCPPDMTTGVVDKVGYGGGLCFETSAAINPTAANQAVFRIVSGADSNNNGSDFQRGVPTPQASGATAANGTLSGKVKNPKGQGLRFCTVMLSGGSLPEPLYSTTNMFGQYRFEDIPLGEGYILQVFSRRYSFEEPSRFINLNQSIADADFIGDER